jgi:hypothetical protein
LIFAALMIAVFVIATFYIFPRTVSHCYSWTELVEVCHFHLLNIVSFQFSWVFLSMTLQSLSTLSISSALQYYYTASKECVPDGE